MSKIKTIDDLRAAIRDLEHQNYVNEQHMRKRVAGIAEKLKPMNIVKGLFSQVFSSSEKKTSLLKMFAGIATSFLVKKFIKKGISAK